MFGGVYGRRPVYFGLCLLSLISCQYMFGLFHSYNTAFVMWPESSGGMTAAFYGWLPLYLPELFPTRVRATGQGLPSTSAGSWRPGERSAWASSWASSETTTAGHGRHHAHLHPGADPHLVRPGNQGKTVARLANVGVLAMTYSRPWMFLGLAQMARAILLCRQGYDARLPSSQGRPGDGRSRPQQSRTTRQPPPPNWKDLFDGKTLDGWKAPQFGGEGKVYVKDGTIVMETGGMMTGVTWTGKPLRNNYELTLEGMRLDGTDFFCTTTFPVGDDPCSLVVGGWGGMVVGLSSIDGLDASENATTKTIDFKDKHWYRVRIRVTDAAIEAWIDDQQVVNQPRKDHKFSIRIEVDLCRPLGICTWDTTGAVRNIRVRAIKRRSESRSCTVVRQLQ